jgi:murein DD-endopeptidase MepM/ murein hydrolase activator NlpD
VGCAAAPVRTASLLESGLGAAPPPVAGAAQLLAGSLPASGPFDPLGPAVASALEPAGSAAEPELPVVPPVAVAAPEAEATEAPDGPPIDPLLVRFAVEARARRLRARSGQGFSAEADAAWRELSRELDGYLARALPQTPLLELVRAQVTVEAEWDFDQRRYGPAPAGLAREVLARAARLGQRVRACRALGQTMFAARPAGPLRWPVERAGLSSPFGMRQHPVDGHRHMHAGIDLSAERGRVVSAAARGYVIRAGWAGGYGLLVEVRHPGELTTRYGHLSALLCAPGDAVDPGQPLGLVGRTGVATGPHLHFEVWRGGLPRDPLAMLGGGTELAVAGSGGGLGW